MDLIKILEVAVNDSKLILINKKISGDYVKLIVDTEDGVTLNQLTKLTKFTWIKLAPGQLIDNFNGRGVHVLINYFHHRNKWKINNLQNN